MSFVRSIMVDGSTQVYFDTFDNKHVRKHGSLAWRCNNPGLVHSHSNIASRYGSIGHHGQYHIFPSIIIGRKALIAWVQLKSYYTKPLLSIAEFQNPLDPETYLLRLCSLSGLDPKDIPSKLTAEKFDKLIWVIEELAGGHAILGNELFYILPKIVGRFISRTKKIDHYLTAEGRILPREIAIDEVMNEKIDAIVVHRFDGTQFLRSRRGFIPSQLYAIESDNQGEPDFKKLAQDEGEKTDGQVIWGFINGIFNVPALARKNLIKMVEAVNGEQVWGFSNPTGSKEIFGLPDALPMKFGFSAKIVEDAIEYCKFLVLLSDNDPKKPPVVIVAHSEGGLIAEFASRQMNSILKKRIQFWTLGGAGLVPEGLCSQGTCNFINQYDLVARAILPYDYKLLVVRDQYKDKGYEFIANFLAEEDALVRGLDFGIEYEFYKNERVTWYKKRLAELSNTQIIYRKKAADIQHAFDDEYYQKKLKDLINEVYGRK